MDIEMTWTVLYTDSESNLLSKSVNAPHGRQEAWDYIRANLKLNIIAIMPGSHDVYSEGEWSVVKTVTEV